MSNTSKTALPESAQQDIDRVMAAERSNIGCGPICTCRARFALNLSEEQLAQLNAHALKVDAGEVTSDEATLKTVVSDLPPFQLWLLDKIARDRHSKPHAEIKGGQDGALQSILHLLQFEHESRLLREKGFTVIEI